jgi:hypothetical protein
MTLILHLLIIFCMSHAMSLVMLVDSAIRCFDRSGVDVVCKPPALDAELDEVLEKVLLRSKTRLV